MELIAYLNGDVTTLTQILSQIAMALGGGTFAVAAKTCAIIGIIVAIFASLLKGGQLNPATFMWPIIVSVLMLLPRVDLVIEDTRGGLARVNDLPIGFAAPISLITHLGVGASNLMTGYLGLDDYAITMDNGHLISLRAPVVYTQVITQPEFQGPAATFSNGLSPTSDVSNYMKTCLQWKAKVAGSDVRLPVLRSRPISDMRIDQAPGTVAASDGRTYECGTLFDRLMAGFESSDFQERLNDAVGLAFGKYQGDTTTGGRYQAALESVIDDPAEFYKTAAFSHALQMIAGDITQAAGGGSQQAALNDALAQKREKNFGAAAMIFETIGHTIEFIEVWSFSLFPLALLILMLGAIGAKMAVKYFWMLVWVQLWYPTLLIVMDYLDVKLKTVAISSTATVATYNSFMLEVLRLQDVGYVHLSMATALSMGLVFGSSAILASNIQRDLTGANHYDPKKNAPDTLSRNALTSFHSPFSYSPNQGYEGHAAKETFAGVTFSYDRRLGEGVTMTEAAQYAATGSRSGSTTSGVAAAHTVGTSAASTKTATDDWAAGSSGTSSIGAATGGRVDAQMGQSVGHSYSDNVRDSISGTAQAGIQGSAGLKALGSGGGVSGGAGISAGRDYSSLDQKKADENFGVGVNLDQSASTREEVGSSLRYGKSETTSENRSESNDRRKTAQTGEQYVEGTSVSRSDTQAKAMTESEMTGRQMARQWDGIKVSNQIARDPDLMNDLVKAVHDSGISNQVDNFLFRNQEKLEGTFGKHNEDAQYAMSALYVMQGMAGNPYRGPDAHERMDVLNAVGDELMLRTGYSAFVGAAADVSMDNLSASQAADPSRVDALFGRVSSGVALEKETVEDALAQIPTAGDPKSAVDSLFALMGGRAEEISEGQGNAILSTARERLDREFGPIDADAMSFLETRRELGWKGAIQNLYRDNHSIRESDVYQSYRDNKDEGWFSEGKGAPQMLEDRMQQLNASGLTTADNDVARFMVATQFLAGATNAGDEAMASQFEKERQDIIDRNPGFGAGDTQERLTALAMLGTNDTTMHSSILRGQQEAMIGGLESQLEAATGKDLNSLGKDVSWQGNGGSSHDPSGFIGGLLGFIRQHEAPNGYSDYFRGSRVEPSRPLETMTIDEVRDWQNATLKEQISRGIPFNERSSAAGGYQIISGTLDTLVNQMGLTGNETFDAAMQDRMALHLLEGRGLSDYQNGHISLDQFGNNVAGEWASMPKLSGAGAGQSVYQGVGTNRSLTSANEFASVLGRA